MKFNVHYKVAIVTPMKGRTIKLPYDHIVEDAESPHHALASVMEDLPIRFGDGTAVEIRNITDINIERIE